MVPRAVCLVLVALIAAVAPARAQQGAAATVKVAHPLEATVTDHLEFTGRFQAIQFVSVEARVSGYLEAVHFVDGQMVKAGDLLYTIDRRPFEADLAGARAELARAQSQLELAQLDLARAEELLPTGAISRETRDNRAATRDVAAADVASAQAAVRTAQLNLDFTEIRSPIDGQISSNRVDVGNVVSGGSGTSTVLTTVVSESPIYFYYDISESTYLDFVRLNASGDSGAAATVKLHLLGETDFNRTGQLDFIDNAFNQGTGTIRMRATFDNPDGLLVPGLFGTLQMASSEPYQALLVPDAAVVSDQSNKLLMTVNADGKVTPKVVELGGMQDGLRVVRSGITADDLVIIEGLLMVRPGSTVTTDETTLTTTTN